VEGLQFSGYLLCIQAWSLGVVVNSLQLHISSPWLIPCCEFAFLLDECTVSAEQCAYLGSTVIFTFGDLFSLSAFPIHVVIKYVSRIASWISGSFQSTSILVRTSITWLGVWGRDHRNHAHAIKVWQIYICANWLHCTISNLALRRSAMIVRRCIWQIYLRSEEVCKRYI